MGKLLILLLLPTLAVLVGVALHQLMAKLHEIPEVPNFRWWGPGQEPPGASKEKLQSRPFRIQVPDNVLEDLKDRLRNTRLTPPLEGVVDFQYGFNTDTLKTILGYWLNTYDWRKQEEKLNSFPQFLIKIEGIDVHYVRVKPIVSEKVKVLPLLIVHGWPKSGVDFYKIISKLTSAESGVAFEVICPSIPGFGFSETPHRPGYTTTDAARTFANLMDFLGHRQYYVQAGDWGTYIVSTMSLLYTDRIRGLHLSWASPSALSPTVSPLASMKYVLGHFAPSLVMEPDRKYDVFPITNLFTELLPESGYFHIQATKPDTVGVGLGDSPAGLAAYILEKFSTFSNLANRQKKDGGLFKTFTMDELLNNVMVYWVTNTITSSVRFYKNNIEGKNALLKFAFIPVQVPTGFAVFPDDFCKIPRSILTYKFPKMLTYNHMERGGHFSALEVPELLSKDVKTFVATCEKYLTSPMVDRPTKIADTAQNSARQQGLDQQKETPTEQETSQPKPVPPTIATQKVKAEVVASTTMEKPKTEDTSRSQMKKPEQKATQKIDTKNASPSSVNSMPDKKQETKTQDASKNQAKKLDQKETQATEKVVEAKVTTSSQKATQKPETTTQENQVKKPEETTTNTPTTNTPTTKKTESDKTASSPQDHKVKGNTETVDRGKTTLPVGTNKVADDKSKQEKLNTNPTKQ